MRPAAVAARPLRRRSWRRSSFRRLSGAPRPRAARRERGVSRCRGRSRGGRRPPSPPRCRPATPPPSMRSAHRAGHAHTGTERAGADHAPAHRAGVHNRHAAGRTAPGPPAETRCGRCVGSQTASDLRRCPGRRALCDLARADFGDITAPTRQNETRFRLPAPWAYALGHAA